MSVPPTPEPTFHAVQEAILQLWDVVNHLSSIQPPKCDRYRVTIFGSARLHAGDPLYEEVHRLASELTRMGCDIVTGGGPGLMEAANAGSVTADPENLRQSIGLRVDLDFEQSANPFVEQLYNHRTFFSRLHHFVLLSNAFVVVPGGIGTTLEALMIWQLLQVRKLENTPLILVGEMWKSLVSWADLYMAQTEPQLASAGDMCIPICVPRMEGAIAYLQDFHGRWQQQCRI